MTESSNGTDCGYPVETSDKRSKLPLASHSRFARVARLVPRKKVPNPPKVIKKEDHLLPFHQVNTIEGGSEKMDCEDQQQQQQQHQQSRASNNVVPFNGDSDTNKFQLNPSASVMASTSNSSSGAENQVETPSVCTSLGFGENYTTVNPNAGITLSTDPKPMERGAAAEEDDSCKQEFVLKGLLYYDKATRGVLIEGLWEYCEVSNDANPVDPQRLFHLECSLGPTEDTRKPLQLDDTIRVFHGSFTLPMKKASDLKIYESGVEMAFSKTHDRNFKVVGKGRNSIGDFQLTGTVIATKRESEYTINMAKKYSFRHSVPESDDKEGNARLQQEGLSNPKVAMTPKQQPPSNIVTSEYGSGTPKAFKKHLLRLDRTVSCEQGSRCQCGASCAQFKRLWVHISNCHSKHCDAPNCAKYKQMLNHFDNCKLDSCAYCAPIIRTRKTWLMARRKVNPEQGVILRKTLPAMTGSVTPPGLFQNEIIFHTKSLGLEITTKANRFVVIKIMKPEYVGRVFPGDELTHVGGIEVRNESKAFVQTVISKSPRPIVIRFSSRVRGVTESSRHSIEAPKSLVRALEKHEENPDNSTNCNLALLNAFAQTIPTASNEKPSASSRADTDTEKRNTQRHDLSTNEEKNDCIEQVHYKEECKRNQESRDTENENIQE